MLGSNGSVVPKFKAQIAAGGPITITHPDMVRYFMTIREACNLVVTAASHALAPHRSPEQDRISVYVLNMGQPVKIMDLAERMIRLSGLEPGRDIEIAVTGVRPGERLNEILFAREEPTADIGIPGVVAARPVFPSLAEMKTAGGGDRGCGGGGKPWPGVRRHQQGGDGLRARRGGGRDGTSSDGARSGGGAAGGVTVTVTIFPPALRGSLCRTQLGAVPVSRTCHVAARKLPRSGVRLEPVRSPPDPVWSQGLPHPATVINDATILIDDNGVRAAQGPRSDPGSMLRAMRSMRASPTRSSLLVLGRASPVSAKPSARSDPARRLARGWRWLPFRSPSVRCAVRC